MPYQRALWLAALLPLTANGLAKDYGLKEGEPFPALRFGDMENWRDGATSTIADFRGSKLMLHIFASW